jgi:hypothetical protein
MKKALVFAMAMALGVSATAFAANPFSDVPAGHWAYAAVAQLAADGVVTGYPDGTFKGDMTMTRYEMAQIVAKALAKGSINDNDALVAEFADELDNLGVRVTKLEKKSDNVKLTGSLRYRYFALDDEATDKSQLRTRIGIAGMINDDWTYKALVENTKNFGHDIAASSSDDKTEFRRAWLQGHIGEVSVTAGRFNYIPQGSNMTIPTEGAVYDHELDGAKLGFGAGDFDVTLAYGRQDNDDNDNNLFIGTVGTTVGATDLSLGYYNEEETFDADDDASIFTFCAAGEVAPDLTLSGMYLNGDAADDGDSDGYVLGLQYKTVNKKVVGSYSLSANYYDQAYATYILPSIKYTSAASSLITTASNDGFKGYRIGADYTVAKNMIASVYYYDLDARDGDDDSQTILSQMNIFF